MKLFIGGLAGSVPVNNTLDLSLKAVSVGRLLRGSILIENYCGRVTRRRNREPMGIRHCSLSNGEIGQGPPARAPPGVHAISNPIPVLRCRITSSAPGLHGHDHIAPAVADVINGLPADGTGRVLAEPGRDALVAELDVVAGLASTAVGDGEEADGASLGLLRWRGHGVWGRCVSRRCRLRHCSRARATSIRSALSFWQQCRSLGSCRGSRSRRWRCRCTSSSRSVRK
jgi:hypothetical protein